VGAIFKLGPKDLADIALLEEILAVHRKRK
jgi:hypothetical protein